MEATHMTKFQVVNSRTKEIKGTYSTKKRARRAVDKFDNEYGCYIHSIVEVLASALLTKRCR
jgi:hypothetical protein